MSCAAKGKKYIEIKDTSLVPNYIDIWIISLPSMVISSSLITFNLS